MTDNRQPYTAVVIGCGFIGSRFNETPFFDPRHTHAASYKMHKKTELIGVCDSDPVRAKQAALHWSVKPYSDAAAMLQQTKPAFVSIASSTASHKDMLELVLQTPSVKSVLCEKPISESASESLKIVDSFRKKNIFFGVNYSRRYNGGFNKVKDMIEKGILGKLQLGHVIYQNGILNNGSHFIDLLRYLVGEISAVRADHEPQAGYTSNLSGILEFKNGLRVMLQGTTPDGAAFAEIDIIGTKGRIRTEQSGHCIFHYDLEPSPLFSGYNDFVRSKNISDGIMDNTYNAVQDLIECVEGQRIAPR